MVIIKLVEQGATVIAAPAINRAVELDRLLPPGETFRFYGQLLDSAVFYSQRDAVVLKT